MCLGEIAELIEVGDGSAVASVGERTRRVSLLTLTDRVEPGDWVLIHSGFALARLTADQARDAAGLRSTSPPNTQGKITEVSR